MFFVVTNFLFLLPVPQEIEPNTGEAFLKLWDRRTSPQQRTNSRYDSQGHPGSGGYNRGSYQGQSLQGQVEHVSKGVEQIGWNSAGSAGYGNGKRQWTSSGGHFNQAQSSHYGSGVCTPQNQGKHKMAPSYGAEYATERAAVASPNPSMFSNVRMQQAPDGAPAMGSQRGYVESTQKGTR